VTPKPASPPPFEGRFSYPVARRRSRERRRSAVLAASRGRQPSWGASSPSMRPRLPVIYERRCPNLCPPQIRKPPIRVQREMAGWIEPRPLPVGGLSPAELRARAAIYARPATEDARLGLHLRVALDLQVGQTRSSHRGIHQLRFRRSSSINPGMIKQHNQGVVAPTPPSRRRTD